MKPGPKQLSSQNVVPLQDHVLQKVVQEHLSPLEGDTRPILLFFAGPNGSGKTSCFNLLDEQQAGRQFPFINADLIASVLKGFPSADSAAQKIADLMREHMLGELQSFATETVFSDEKGVKINYLERAATAGFRVILIYVALANVHLSRQRVAFRVAEGMGHDVPTEKLQRRFVASRENCRRALNFVDTAIILDNSMVADPLRPMAVVKGGKTVFQASTIPKYVQELLPFGSATQPQAPAQAAAQD